MFDALLIAGRWVKGIDGVEWYVEVFVAIERQAAEYEAW